MQTLEIQGAFGLENLRVVDRPEPVPGPGQVLLALRAASLNYRDLMMVEGRYNPRQALPLVPGSDGVGEVLAVGPGVERVKVGDRVSPIFASRWTAGDPTPAKMKHSLGGPADGTFTERMLAEAEGLVHVPAHLADEEAATLPCAGLTAWSAIVTQGRVAPGDTVLVQGTGGVSIFALQFAKLAGARVIVTSSSDEKLARARTLGADETINYRSNPEWGKLALELTNGRGVDHVVEVGGAGTLEQSVKAVRFAGTISIIGVLAGAAAPFNVVPVLMRNLRLQGVVVGSREGFEAMNRALAAARLVPAVDRVFPFAEARAAFELMAAGGHFGKICLRF